MSYLVLARKYRSQSFSEIVSQEHVTQTLQNAILSGRLAHAILFCGPRGTGKTSIARILAKAMNCAEGPSPAPCNQCRSCREITAGNAVDVMEIDGASNNSVDQVRELREGLGYMPAHSRYRIYIIDEVHMLSTAAFNALLKTLEEPPEHVLFFFATTEPHKIPLTILSRCQRHDLRRVGLPALTAHLAALCQAESVDMEAEALDMVAREADGSVRDALSLLDRVIASLKGETGTRDKVARILGVAARGQAFRMADALFRQDAGAMLSIIRDLHDGGADFKKFHGDLAAHIRNLLIARVQPKDCRELLDLPDAMVQDLFSQAAPLTEHYLSRLLDMLMAEDGTMRYASHPRLAMETLLLRCMRIQPALSIDRLVERLDALRQEVMHAPEAAMPLPSPVGLNSLSAPGPTAHISRITQAPSTPPPMPGNSPAAQAESAPDPETASPIPDPPPFPESSRERPLSRSPEARPSPPEPAPSPPEENLLPCEDTRPDSAPPGGDASGLWPVLIARLRQTSPSLGELFAAKTALKKLSDQSIEIEVQGTGFSMARFTPEKTRLVENLAAEIFGRPLSLHIRSRDAENPEQLRGQSEKELLRNDAMTHALVQDALEIFKGRIMDVSMLKEAR